ncbi:MAG: hypothetical protein ABR518_06330 [Actinomycetota bacterium]
MVIPITVVVVAGVAVTWLIVAAVHRRMEARLMATDAELRRLADGVAFREHGAEEVRREVLAFRQILDGFRVRDEERRGREDQAWTALNRVSSVLAGSQRAGRAGENVLLEALGHLPPSMLVRDFRVNGRVVEFGLVLPDGRRLAVDSKWPAEREVAALADCTDPLERDRLVKLIERTVTERAREVSGYRDPAITAPVAVAAVPDAAYAVLRRAHADAYRQGVVVIPYSMALPTVLFLHAFVSRFGSATDLQACLNDLSAILDGLELTLENKVAKAATMLANGADELRGHVGKARAIVTGASAIRPVTDDDEPPSLADPAPSDAVGWIRITS